MRSLLALLTVGTFLMAHDSGAQTPSPAPADPRQYLEEIEGEKALAWVKAHNQPTLDRLTKDPRFAANQAEALKILEAKDRIPAPSFSKYGVDNFWQDDVHVRGLWRRASWESYRSGEPKWETILDIDALAKAEGKNWVYKGKSCLPSAYDRCLIYLSNGGKDAVSVREFDIPSKSFVAGGFALPEGKQHVDWVDLDTIYVAREWTPGDMTPSGYAYIAKVLKRGQSLDQAVEIYRGQKTDMTAGVSVLRDEDGKRVIDIASRKPSFFESEEEFLTAQGPVKLPLPLTSEMVAYASGQAVYQLKSPWTSKAGTHFAQGVLITFDLAAALKDPAGLEPTVLFAPTPRQSVDGVSQTRNRVLITIDSNVVGELRSYAFADGKWTHQVLDLPKNSTLSVGSTDDFSDRAFVWQTGFLDPSTLYFVDAVSGKVERLKRSPERFNAEGLVVEQHEAASKDGTLIPYFIVHRKDLVLNGNNPTLIYAYGGFEISMKPSYSGGLGKLWLEKGGVYVLANIRGGGEFGPKWHEAGLKTHRQVIYDDFQAVAEDLISRKITTPRHLGIQGGSNGGLLMGVQLTQRPDLWNAVVIQVPLLDMLRYTHLSAGASWIGEYGDPEKPEEAAFLKSISPYHNLKAGVKYPEPLFVTSTKDDRVHPGHARKMAALMEDMHLPFLYYENTDGGHAASANLKESARRTALEYTYLAEKLMD